MSKNPFENFNWKSIVEKANIPSVEDIQAQAPTIEEFQSIAENDMGSYVMEKLGIDLGPIDKIKSSIETKVEPIVDKYKSKLIEKIGFDPETIMNVSSTSEMIHALDEKVGLPAGLMSKYEEVEKKVEEMKEYAKEKTIEGIKTAGKKVGIDIPDIPSEEELTQMIANMNPDEIATIDQKMEAIETFIQSKLNS